MTNKLDVIRRRARNRLALQTLVPKSPGCLLPSGEVALCYGAALASSAVEVISGAHAGESVANYLATRGTKSDIVAIGSKHGLASAITLNAIVHNDDCCDSQRKILLLDVL